MVFKIYNSEKELSNNYIKIDVSGTINKKNTLLVCYENTEILVAIKDKNNNGEIFEGLIELIDGDKERYKLIDPNSPKKDSNSLTLKVIDLEGLFEKNI